VLRPKTFVVTRHNAEAFFPKAPRFLSILLSRFVLKRAFACISISNAVASFLKSAKEIPDGSDSLVIYYGTANQSVSKSHKPTLDAHSLFRIGTVARLTTQKNIPLLLNAIGELQNYNVREFNLSIAGTGPLEKDLKRMAQQLGISQNVKWVGKIKEIEAFYRNLDLFVLTSDYEGFGLVLLEAMSQGIPIIARRVSAIPEVLGIGHPGLIDSDNPIELATKIRSFLTQPHTMERCVQYQYLKIKDFSIDRTRKSHGLVYKSLLESQDRRSL
jgi:glycosyltransferase involved in cell wall biosynthesis